MIKSTPTLQGSHLDAVVTEDVLTPHLTGAVWPVSTDGTCLVVCLTSFRVRLQAPGQQTLMEEVLHSMDVDQRQDNEEELLCKIKPIN